MAAAAAAAGGRSADPRDESAVKEWTRPAEEESADSGDVFTLLSMVMGAFGFFMKVRSAMAAHARRRTHHTHVTPAPTPYATSAAQAVRPRRHHLHAAVVCGRQEEL